MILFQHMNTTTLPLITDMLGADHFAAGTLVDLLGQYADDHFTGAAAFIFDDAGTFTGIFVRGNAVEIYSAKMGAAAERLIVSDWIGQMSASKGGFACASISLNIQDLRLLKVLLEDNVTVIHDQDKFGALATAGNSKTPAVVRAYSQETLQMWFFPGSRSECRGSLLLSAEQVIHAPTLDTFEQEQPDAGQIGLLLPNFESLAWRELIVSQFFAYLILRMFNLMEQFKGRTLLNRVIKSFNFKGEANDWFISANARDMDDGSMFVAAEQKAIYTQMLAPVISDFVAEIGKPFLDGILLDLLSRYPEEFWPELRSLLDSAQ